MPLEYYHGVDGGESWSEGKRKRKVYLSRPEKGTYVVRLAAQWEEGKTPPGFTLRVREGGFRFPHFLLAFLALSVPAFFAVVRMANFEMARWRESSHSPYSALEEMTSDDDEE
jgi:hypothetical protein